MRFARLYGDRRAALLLRLLASVALLPLVPACAQDSSSDTSAQRTDRPEISLTVRDRTGDVIKNAGTVKLLHDGVLAGESSLSHGRAFFNSLPFGDYSLVVEVTGYKSTQRDVNLSVAMRYEIDANLEREGGSSEAAGVPAKPLLAPKAKEALDKSLKALSKDKLPEAEKYIAEAAQLASGHPDVLYVQGILFLKRENWAEAQSALEKASQMDPTNARAFSALGMALEDEGQYAQAIVPLEKSLQLDGKDWEPQWVLGEAFYHLQQYDQALKASQLAWTQSNGKAPQVELLLAKAQKAVGKYEDAAQSLRDFLKRYGDRPEAPTARRYLERLAGDGKIHSH